MKDIILGEIGKNTIELLRLAKGKIDGKNIELELLHDSNADGKEPAYDVSVRRRIWWHLVSFGISKPFTDESEANTYFSSLMEKHKLTEVF